MIKQTLYHQTIKFLSLEKCMKFTNIYWSQSRSGAGEIFFAGARARVELGPKIDRLANPAPHEAIFQVVVDFKGIPYCLPVSAQTSGSSDLFVGFSARASCPTTHL